MVTDWLRVTESEECATVTLDEVSQWSGVWSQGDRRWSRMDFGGSFYLRHMQLHPSSSQVLSGRRFASSIFSMHMHANALSDPSNVSSCLQTVDGLPTIPWHFKALSLAGRLEWLLSGHMDMTSNTLYLILLCLLDSPVCRKVQTQHFSRRFHEINTIGYLLRQFGATLSSAVFL